MDQLLQLTAVAAVLSKTDFLKIRYCCLHRRTYLLLLILYMIYYSSIILIVISLDNLLLCAQLIQWLMILMMLSTSVFMVVPEHFSVVISKGTDYVGNADLSFRP